MHCLYRYIQLYYIGVYVCACVFANIDKYKLQKMPCRFLVCIHIDLPSVAIWIRRIFYRLINYYVCSCILLICS